MPRGPRGNGEAVDSTARTQAAPVQVKPRSFAREDVERPYARALSHLLGAALGGVRRALPKPLRSRLSRAPLQYRPRPLTVPASYLRQQPPDDAPAISLVTPAGNHVPYLRRTIESVLGQAYPNLEYIVVHDGSNEATTNIVDAYREKLEPIELHRDRGQPHAINHGLARSRGELMAWLNSDDVLLPGALAQVGRYLVANPEVDVVYGYRVLLDADDRDIGIWVTPRHRADSLQWYDFVPQETVFWRRSLWDRVGGIDESVTLAFDWDLFSRFHRSGAKIVRLPHFLGGYRQHPAQRSRVEYGASLMEQAAVREVWHGRSVPRDELRGRIFPIAMRALPYYAWYLAETRLPIGRVEVSFRSGTQASDGPRPDVRWTA